jgi:sortase (surface protein transpeptidase)
MTGVRAGRVVAVIALTGLTVGCGADASTVDAPASTQPAPSWAIAPADATPAAVARPVRLRIPAIDVDSAVVDVGIDAAGTLLPPGAPEVAGWFAAGTAPGAIGPALLAGHIDSRTGPAVFHRLVDLREGDVVLVDRADATTVSFTVRTTTHVPKTRFPTELVYAPVPVPVLRLVTCGGDFDSAAHSYRDNVIVEAYVQ